MPFHQIVPSPSTALQDPNIPSWVNKLQYI